MLNVAVNLTSKMATKLSLFIIVAACLVFTLGQEACNQQRTCRECFAASSACRWCGSKDYDGRTNCGTLEQLSNCPVSDIRSSYSIATLSPACHGVGDEECGICNCRRGQYGKRCECEEDDFEGEPCKESPTAVECSRRGTCICGQCRCSAGFYGRYCEEDDTCPLHYATYKSCGGPGIGKCRDGNCVCEPGFSGPACECEENIDACRSRNGMLCNGKGTCTCGICMCDSYYTGRACEDCPTCPGECEKLRNCVRHFAFKTGPLHADDFELKCEQRNSYHEYVFSLADLVASSEAARVCRFFDDDNECLFKFSYNQQRDFTSVVVQKDQMCG